MSSRKDAKSIWLDEGLRILETKGPAMLSIDTLAARTKKTKGSFYHHFTSREKYIKSLLEYYEKISTIEVFTLTSDDTNPRESLKTLTKLTFQLSGGLELAIRAWALYDPKVRRFQDRLDRQRIGHLKRLHVAAGMDAGEAGLRSYRDYSLYIGLQQIRHHHSDAEFRKLLKSVFNRG